MSWEPPKEAFSTSPGWEPPAEAFSYWGDVGKNALTEIKDMVPTKEGVTENFKNLAALTAVPTGGIPTIDDIQQSKKFLTEQLPEMGIGMAKDMYQTVRHPIEHFREKPIGTVMNAATLAAPLIPNGAFDEAAYRSRRFGQEQALKTIESSRGQVMQVGPDEARQLGQFALDKGIISPFKGELGMERSLNALDQEAGAAVGSARRAGDLTGKAPDPLLLKNNIEAELSPRYETGMRHGERGALGHALDEVGKIEEPSFTGVARKASEMNRYAKGMHQLNQPSGALTDVANVLSRENNAALQQALTPEQFSAYKTALSDYGSIQKLQEFFLRKESRELAGRGGGFWRGVKDAVGHKTAAVTADSMADFFSNPAVAKALPALANAARVNPSTLETTHFLMQKNDPEYASQTGGKQDDADAALVQAGPDTVIANVLSDPNLQKWAPAFQDAAKRSMKAVTALHFSLLQRDPEYNQGFSNRYVPPNR